VPSLASPAISRTATAVTAPVSASVAPYLFTAPSLQALAKFGTQDAPLGICERTPTAGSDQLFKALLASDVSVGAKITHDNADADAAAALAVLRPVAADGPDSADMHRLFDHWVKDIADICRMFCTVTNSDFVGMRLTSARGCERYHMDYVPARLLVTYAGPGTQWIPPHAASLTAYENGGDNSAIAPDPGAVQTITPWDVAIFRGAPDGILHRTPPEALTQRSLLLRLDGSDFWRRAIDPTA